MRICVALLILAIGTIMSIAVPRSAAATRSEIDSFAPGAIWRDTKGIPINAHGGGILDYRGAYYWYGEHKIAGTAGNVAHVGVQVYSSKDLYNWTNRGVALSVSSNPYSDITDGCIIERPKVIYNRKTRTFVMWFHLELKGQGYRAARSGVAVSRAPTGPYTYLGSFRPNGQMARDMNLFVDDDGTAYQIFSSEENSVMDLSKLSDDYLKPSGKYWRNILPLTYREAPALVKYAGKYYVMTSGTSGWAPNAANISVADKIWGPYQSMGNPCVGTPVDDSTTFNSQSTFILPLKTKHGMTYIYMGDRWNPNNAIDGRYVWLPLVFINDKPQIAWATSWSLPR